jgi:hypothetical protein
MTLQYRMTAKFTTLLLLLGSVILFFSCDRTGTFPLITFKTDPGYTSDNLEAPAGTPVKIGILAAKDTRRNVLKTFDVSQTITGQPTRTIYNIKIPTSQEDEYSYDFKTTMDTAGTVVKYVFTVANKDGLNNSVNITLTSK